jgi:hypothetical protein
MSLENAILQTLVYSDIFDFPLTPAELHRYLQVASSREQVAACAAAVKKANMRDGYYFLSGREEIVAIRKAREDRSRSIFKRALFYGRILGALPFIRMVALTGSLAMLNLSKNPDIDYMLVSKHGRVWTARAFAIVLGRIANLLGDTLCPNLIVSEQALEWPLHDLYSARELCQMIPIAGYDMYLNLFGANRWVTTILPNANPIPGIVMDHEQMHPFNIFESILQTKIGSLFESWEMNRKAARFSKQAGFGAETIFTADVCQGNFNHHRKWTSDLYRDRLLALGIDSGTQDQALFSSVSLPSASGLAR